jgi:NitT/TauT family transport system substrate-binding protein
MMQAKSTFRRRAPVIALIVGVIAFVALGIWRGFGPPARTDKQKVVIAQAGDFFLYAPLYVAIDAGHFDDEGLDVSLVTTGGDEKTWAAVISGNASFGVADPTFIAISDARGVPGRVIANIVNGVPFWGVTFRKDIKPFKSADDLDSYTIGTFPSPSTAFTLQRKMFLDARKEPRIREGAFGTLVAMLRSGQVDIALELEPNVSQVVADGGIVVYSLAEVYGDFAITGLTATPEFLARNPQVAQKVANALQKALNSIRLDREKALSILAKRFPEIDRNIAKAALDRVIADNILPRSLQISEGAWTKAINLRIGVGDLKEPKPISSYVDNTFANAAADSLGPK